MQAQRLAEADEQAGERPGEPCVIVAADKNEENEEGLNNSEVGLDEELGFCQRLLKRKSVLLDQRALLRAKIEFYLRVSAGHESNADRTRTSSSSSEMIEA